MSSLSLAALLDEDKELVLAGIAGDRSLSAAQAALEKEIDRVMYRYVELCGDPALRESAQHILQAVKNTLPMMDAVGEARAWKKQADASGESGLSLKPMSLALLLGGLVLVLASVIGVLIAGRSGGALAFGKALIPVALGCGCLFFAGAQAAKPGRKGGKAPESDVRTEFLADGEKAWHCLRGALVQADGQLERIREERAAQQVANPADVRETGLTPAVLDLFGELLESSYASRDEGARESASAIRFYLHNQRVEVVDYGAGRDSWFEFLPAARPGTIRPALVSEGKLLKKGLCSR